MAEVIAAVFAVYVADLERCLRHFRVPIAKTLKYPKEAA